MGNKPSMAACMLLIHQLIVAYLTIFDDVPIKFEERMGESADSFLEKSLLLMENQQLLLPLFPF
jgi:hypothetical protein